MLVAEDDAHTLKLGDCELSVATATGGAGVRVVPLDAFESSLALLDSTSNPSNSPQPAAQTTWRSFAETPLNFARRAPELRNPLLGARTPAVDVWALGVLAFQLLSSDQASPFSRATDAALKDPRAQEAAREMGGRSDVACLKALPGRLGVEAPHFVVSCLPPQVAKRPTAVELTAHPLFWSDADVAARLEATHVALTSKGASEAAMAAALSAVKVDVASLASWRARVPPDVLASAEQRHSRGGRLRRWADGAAALRPQRGGARAPEPRGGGVARERGEGGGGGRGGGAHGWTRRTAAVRRAAGAADGAARVAGAAAEIVLHETEDKKTSMLTTT